MQEKAKQRVEIVEGDTFNQEELAQALVGIDVAFYLIHSMGADKDFRVFFIWALLRFCLILLQ